MIELQAWAVVDIFSIAMVLLLAAVILRKNLLQSEAGESYLLMLICVMLLEAGDILAHIQAAGTIYPSVIGRYLAFCMQPAYTFALLGYASAWTDIRRETKRKWLLIQGMYVAADILLVTVNLRTGWFFSYGEDLIYRHGPYFAARFKVLSVFSFVPEAYLIRYRKAIATNIRVVLMTIIIMPIAGFFSERIFTGATLSYASMAITSLILYLFVQDLDLNTDTLTALANRRTLDIQLKERIRRAASAGRKFSLILLDIDDFKQINDRFGHNEGDEALRAVGRILRDSFRKDDLVARYGGDEFCVMTDIDMDSNLEAAAERIRNAFRRFNEKHLLPCELSSSIGYAVFDGSLTEDQTLQCVDQLMYREKRKRKEKRGFIGGMAH